eukprot:TRINITY_DN1311_c0_g1_i1.p1 TRINITY_DN1311_c0_g1~~TRINITY_DN1311_c0_g1_i1.p1  ORF type:complete len:527 (-),score=126.94 TRINITY_DN1311_c0_g1_i1:1305-2885(-)
MEETREPLPEGFKYLTEGKATVIYNEKEVFYNPVQQFNRDLSILMIKLFIEQRKEEVKKEGINILEALSATGLRSIRYFKEIEGINTILVNDIEPAAVETIRKNIEFNKIDTSKCIPNQGDATMVMYNASRDKTLKFDVVDLDPYGTASPFLDAAVQAVDNGGLLCVTCTDLAVLCGSHNETCFAKYNAIPVKGRHCHEFALRIVLANIQSHAIRYKRYIQPVVSIYVDFYVRIFVRVFDSAQQTKNAFSRVGMAFQCGGCNSFWTKPYGVVEKDAKGNSKYKMTIGPPVGEKCPYCTSSIKMGGPLWLDSIHDVNVVKKALSHLSAPETKELYKTHKRIFGLFSVCGEELPDVPLFYLHSALFSTLKLESAPLDVFRSSIISAGYRVSGSHCDAVAIKTDAPNDVLWDILRCWHKVKPANMKKFHENSPPAKILAVEPKITVDFTLNKDAVAASRSVSRFIPQPGGGPKPRAKGKRRGDPINKPNDEKRRKIDDGGENKNEKTDVMDVVDSSNTSSVSKTTNTTN